ncbi:hypothetical protein DM860_001480 [Cuscuta australis]|uniref:DUF8040 domain-containing protein n=1 Tax=Cuscuta australis TaxID=267555 RepID=A0A328E8V6_9ASTE|nr:hypothetical protein DM860_001480 [Cuscuta australis]
MNQLTLRELCKQLEVKCGFKSSNRISVLEKVALFVFVLSKGSSNRDTHEHFQHYGETMSRISKEVLKVMD